MKMNKKGFTLIEMLVVIAIIAVLVSIVVPAVSNSTVKAKASTDAANLRSLAAEAQIAVLNAGYSNTTSKDVDLLAITDLDTAVDGNQTVLSANSKATKSKTDESLTLGVKMTTDGSIVCTFGEYTIEDFADVADGTAKNVAEAHKDNTAA